KTSVTLGLAGAAWERGLRALVVDLDPQGNASTVLDPPEVRFTASDVLADPRPHLLTHAGARSGWGPEVDVLAAHSLLERHNVRGHSVEHRFRLEELRTTYGDLLLEPALPDRTAVQQAEGACVPVQAWRSPGAREVAEALDDHLEHLVSGRHDGGPLHAPSTK